MHDSPDLRKQVRDLACALLQIRQGIEFRFLTAPLGLKTTKISDESSYTINKKTSKWDRALMGATNFSQIFLHYNILYDSIRWSRAANKAACQLCRRKKDPEKMLLCDKCNCGCHMYCLKPKLKIVPDGDWFCPKCAPPKVDKKPAKKRRRLFSEEEEGTADSDNSDSDEIRERPTQIKNMEKIYDELESDFEDELQSDDYSAMDNSMITNLKKKSKNKKKKPKLTHLYDQQEDEFSIDDDVEPEEKPKVKKKAKKSNQKEEVSKTSGRAQRNQKKNVVDYMELDDTLNDDNDEEPLVTKKSNRKVSKKKVLEVDTSEIENETPPKNRKRKKGKKSDSDISDDEEVANTKSNSKKSRRSKSANEPSSRSSRSNGGDLNKSSSGRDRRSHAINDDLPLHNVILYDLLEEISKHSDSWPFNRPVSKQEVPDYYDIIITPMDFAKIKSRLNLGYYKSDYDIMGDIQQIFINCDIYNTTGTEIFE